MIAYALRALRQALTLISFFTVLFTEQIPRPLFDAIVMTYRYEWRAMSYAFFMHEDYPPFDFDLSSEDDGAEPHTSLRLTYPASRPSRLRTVRCRSWPATQAALFTSCGCAPENRSLGCSGCGDYTDDRRYAVPRT
jgi:hypothetical protein